MRHLLHLLALTMLLTVVAAMEPVRTHTFDEPIDALSIGILGDDIDLAVSALHNGKWTEWQELEIEKEFDPLLQESNLVIFPKPTTQVRIRGTTKEYALHPIRISHDPVRIELASRILFGRPRIITRRMWGADDSFLITGPETKRSDVKEKGNENENGDVPKRVRECEEAHKNHPSEFRTSRTVAYNSREKRYRWPMQYSPQVNLLVVHHTAQKVGGDERTPVERVRALYTYHANSRGWGDIGYHYMIDENGDIYEGRAGGDYVVGGHVYCGNIGTIGVALMGNFEMEKPSQMQMKSLQWLLDQLAQKYYIDPQKNVIFHGKKLQAIVGHGSLVSTACPGYNVRETLAQVQSNVITGNIDAAIIFPRASGRYRDNTNERRARRATGVRYLPPISTLSPVGSTVLEGRPGGQVSLIVRLQAGGQFLSRRSRIADVERSDSRIGVWQDLSGNDIRVRHELILPEALRPGESQNIELRVQFPRTSGNYTLRIGEITYTLSAEGRRARSPIGESSRQSFRPDSIVGSYSRTYPTWRPSSTTRNVVNTPPQLSKDTIRIHLGFEGEIARLSLNRPPLINMNASTGRNVELVREGNACTAYQRGSSMYSGVVRIDPRGGISTINNWAQDANRFRGIIECRVINGQLVLINELSLEDYLAGLAEEPDTEPFEKQRAFAVAARSYAAHYMDPANRKFKGKPYDGDDSPKRFQMYGGVSFEEKNPQWVEAVHSTAGKVIAKNGQIVKAAYFSASNGRTRSPEEIGWKSFPFPEVFQSKPDPWCEGMQQRGHGVGMSGCGAKGQANEGKTAEEILEYYYPLTSLDTLRVQ